MTLAIVELELTPGLWTPHAQILCVGCHGGLWPNGTHLDAKRFRKQPLDPNMDSAIAVCDECGKSIWMDYKVAWEQRIVLALKDKGLDADMSQTGGMCSAATLLLDGDEDGGQKYVMITESEDNERPLNDPTFVVGYYHEKNPYGDDVEGEYGDDVPLPLAEAVALVEKIAKEGGFYV